MTSWPDGYGRIVMDQVGSTLDEGAVLAARQGGAFWVMAHRQTEARGRRGRRWEMLEGNFAATLMLPHRDSPADAALRSFVMSLALWRALVEMTARAELFTLKWPNDVLMDGGKLAGILLENGAASGYLAIGVGVNLAAAPDLGDLETGALRPVSLRGMLEIDIAPDEFLTVLAAHYALLEAEFQSFGFAPIREAWLERAARLGEVIVARTGREEITGTFEDVDVDGQLVIRAPRGLRRVPAAEIYF